MCKSRANKLKILCVNAYPQRLLRPYFKKINNHWVILLNVFYLILFCFEQLKWLLYWNKRKTDRFKFVPRVNILLQTFIKKIEKIVFNSFRSHSFLRLWDSNINCTEKLLLRLFRSSVCPNVSTYFQQFCMNMIIWYSELSAYLIVIYIAHDDENITNLVQNFFFLSIYIFINFLYILGQLNIRI